MHSHYIEGVLYIPEAPFCFLSPQHWSQQAQDNSPNKHGTWCATYDDECVLLWNQQQHKRSAPWDPATNTARFWSASGTLKYRVYAATQDAYANMERHEHVVFQAEVRPHLIPNDEEESSTTDQKEDRQSTDELDDTTEMREEDLTDFFQQTPPAPAHRVIDDDEENLTAISPQAELLRWHYRLGHTSFKKIKLLALLGMLPRKLATASTPKCAGCMHGALMK